MICRFQLIVRSKDPFDGHMCYEIDMLEHICSIFALILPQKASICFENVF